MYFLSSSTSEGTKTSLVLFLGVVALELVLEAVVRRQSAEGKLRKWTRIRDRDTAQRAEEKIRSLALLWLTLLVVAVGALSELYFSVEPYLERGFIQIMTTLGLRGTQLLIGFGVVLSGFGAFFLKLTFQKTYGCVEVIFAGIAAVITARQMKPGADWSGQIATLIGAVYIVSRGLGNIKDGLEAKA